MTTKVELESKIENYFIDQINAIDGLTYKFKSVERGVPDRLVAYNGNLYLIELKRPGEVPRKSQRVVQAKFAKQQIPIFNLDTTKKIDDFVRETLKASPKKIVKTIEKPQILSNDQFQIN